MKITSFRKLGLFGIQILLVIALVSDCTSAGYGMGSGYGGGFGGSGSGYGGGSGSNGGSGGGALSYEEEIALNDALREEWYAYDTYNEACRVLGNYNPMYMIKERSETQHISALKNLHIKYGLNEPGTRYPVDAHFECKPQGCQVGKDAEIRNIAFYDRHLNGGWIKHSDIINVFTNLMSASKNHLQAFTNCAGACPPV